MEELLEYGQELDLAIYEIGYYTESSDIIYDLTVFVSKILQALIDFFKKMDEKISKTIYKLKLHHSLRQLKREYANNKAEFVKRMSGKKPTFFDMAMYKKEANEYINAASDAITRIDKSFRIHNVDKRIDRDVEFITDLTKKYEKKLDDKDRFIKTASSWDEAIDKYIYNIEHYEGEMKDIEDKTKKVYELSKEYVKRENEDNKELVSKAAASRKARIDFAHGVKLFLIRFAAGLIVSGGVYGMGKSTVGLARSRDVVTGGRNVAKFALGDAMLHGGVKMLKYADKLDRDYKEGK